MRGYGLEQRDPRMIAVWEWAVISVVALSILLGMAYAVIDTEQIADRVAEAAQTMGPSVQGL